MHFVPTGLLMYVEELPQVIRDVLDIIEFLAKKSENLEFYNEENEALFDQALAECKLQVDEVSSIYTTKLRAQ